jgi:ferredoxin
VENAVRVIDPARCTECVGFYERQMCQVECPVECCLPDLDHAETPEKLLAKAKSLYPDYQFDEIQK